MLKGDETAKNYADVLAKIRYYNTRPDSYNKRMYTVHCAMMGGRVLSNEFVVQVCVQTQKHRHAKNACINTWMHMCMHINTDTRY